MQHHQTTIQLLLFLGIVSSFFYCNRQTETPLKIATPPSIGTVVNQLPSNITLIYQDQKNNYWLGSKGKGVYCYNGQEMRLFTPADGLVDTHILTIQEDTKGSIYFDTPEGVSQYDGQAFTTLPIAKQHAHAKKNWVVGKNVLWFRIGWEQKGPYRFDGEYLYALEFPKSPQEATFYAINPNASYSPYGIYSIYQDSKGHTWFGTANLGIYRYDGQQWSWVYQQPWTETPAGGSFGIRSIVEDQDGYFLFCKADLSTGQKKWSNLKSVNLLVSNQ